MDAIGMVTAPIWRTLAIGFIVAFLLACLGSGTAISVLYGRNVDLSEALAKLKAENVQVKAFNETADLARKQAEEQCESKCESLRNRPSGEINPNEEVDDSLVERLRRGGMRNPGDGVREGSPAPRTDTGPSGKKVP